LVPLINPIQPFLICTILLSLSEEKQHALDVQYGNHPERFVRGRPIVPMPRETVAINPITETEGGVDPR